MTYNIIQGSIFANRFGVLSGLSADFNLVCAEISSPELEVIIRSHRT